MVEGRKRLERGIRGHLTDLSATAERALAAAEQIRSSGEAAIATEIERLSQVRQEIEELSRAERRPRARAEGGVR